MFLLIKWSMTGITYVTRHRSASCRKLQISLNFSSSSRLHHYCVIHLSKASTATFICDKIHKIQAARRNENEKKLSQNQDLASDYTEQFIPNKVERDRKSDSFSCND